MQYSFYTSPKYNNFTTKAYKKPTNLSLTNYSEFIKYRSGCVSAHPV